MNELYILEDLNFLMYKDAVPARGSHKSYFGAECHGTSSLSFKKVGSCKFSQKHFTVCMFYLSFCHSYYSFQIHWL